jgi:purine-binding chemotaxis protein CheW
MDSRVTKSKLQVVQFSCRNFYGCIDINYLCRIIALPLLTPTPEGPRYIVGLLNLHGSIIPVIDLALRLKIASPLRRQQFGMIVEKVGEVAVVDEAMMQKTIVDTSNMPLINGGISFKEQISLLININQLFVDDHNANRDQRESE